MTEDREREKVAHSEELERLREDLARVHDEEVNKLTAEHSIQRDSLTVCL